MGFMRGAIDKLKRKPSVNHLVAPSIASDDAFSDAPPYNQPYPGPVGMDGTRIPRGMNPGGTYGGNNARYGSASGRANLNPIMESDPQYDPHYTIPGANGNRRPGPSPTAPHQYQQPPPQQQPYGQYPSTPTTPSSGHPGSSNGSNLSGTTAGTQETGYTRYSGDSYRAPPPPPPNTNNTRSVKPSQQPPQKSSAIPNPQDFADPKASTAEVRRCIGLLRKLYRLKMSTWSRQRVHIAVQHKRAADRRKAEDLLRDIHQIVHDWRTMPPGNWSPQEQEEINFIFQNLSMLQPFWDEGPPESAGPGAGYGGHHGVPHGASYGRPVFR